MSLHGTCLLSTRQTTEWGRRLTGQKFNKSCKKCQTLEFHDHIWYHYEKCIQISTNMPSIVLVILEITWEMLECWENKKDLFYLNWWLPRAKCNTYLTAGHWRYRGILSKYMNISTSLYFMPMTSLITKYMLP